MVVIQYPILPSGAALILEHNITSVTACVTDPRFAAISNGIMKIIYWAKGYFRFYALFVRSTNSPKR